MMFRAKQARKRSPPSVSVVDPNPAVIDRYQVLFPVCRYSLATFDQFLLGRCRWKRGGRAR
jgi:hypothetical protein